MAKSRDTMNDEASAVEDHRSQLIQDIELAFKTVKLSEGVTLHEAIAIDNYSSAQEQKAARNLDSYQRWQDIPEQDIVDCQSALSFLDKQGFKFHLPAFLRISLKYFPEDPAGIQSSCEFQLTREQGKSARQSDPAVISQYYGFSAPQIEVIARYLRFIADYDPYHEGQSFIQAVKKWEALAS